MSERALKQGALRVVAGSAKGRRLAVPRGETTRPTAERVREALFSILAPRLPGARVLDLFAGSGALGVEALSRGAASAHFVDSDAAAAAAIRANTAGLEGCELCRRDAHAALVAAAADGRLYDLVFIDPPYRTAARVGTELGEAIVTVLAPGGVVVTESDRRAPMELPTLRQTDRRIYGDTVVGFHEH